MCFSFIKKTFQFDVALCRYVTMHGIQTEYDEKNLFLVTKMAIVQ